MERPCTVSAPTGAAGGAAGADGAARRCGWGASAALSKPGPSETRKFVYGFVTHHVADVGEAFGRRSHGNWKES